MDCESGRGGVVFRRFLRFSMTLYPRRTAKDYLLPLLIIVLVGVAIGLAWNLYSKVASPAENPASFAGSASVAVLAGEVEAYLPARDAWQIVPATGVELKSGERIRTGTAASAAVILQDGSTLTLDAGSELALAALDNSLTSRSAEVQLLRGAVAVEPGTGDLVVSSGLLRLDSISGAFLFALAGENEQISVTSGALAAAVLDTKNPNSPDLTQAAVSAGETLTASEKLANLLRIGGKPNLVAATPATISALPLYRALPAATVAAAGTDSLPSQLPATGTTVAPVIPTQPTTPTTQPATPAVESLTPATALTAPVVSGGNALTATKAPVEVRGTVAAGTAAVEVTPAGGTAYRLAGFKSGATSWLYRASPDFGNLKTGFNSFSVVAIDAAGNRSAATTFTVQFSPESAATDSGTGTEAKPATETPATTPTTPTQPTTQTPTPATPAGSAGAPTILSPADGYEATGPVRISGTAPAGTVSIEVTVISAGNIPYKLAGFTGPNWAYNADPKFENIFPGKNVYRITATDAAGNKASSDVVIYYMPLAAEPVAPAAGQ